MNRKKLYKAKKNWLIGLCVGGALALGITSSTLAYASDNTNATGNDTVSNISSGIDIAQHVTDAIKQHQYDNANDISPNDEHYEVHDVPYTPMSANSFGGIESIDTIRKHGIYADGVPIISYNNRINNHALSTSIVSADQSKDYRTTITVKSSNHSFNITGPEAEAPFGYASNFEFGDALTGNGKLSFSQKAKHLRIVTTSEANVDQADDYNRLFNKNIDRLQTIYDIREQGGIITNKISYYEDSINPLRANIIRKSDHPFKVKYTGGLECELNMNNSWLEALEATIISNSRPIFKIDNTNLFYNYISSGDFDLFNSSKADDKPITLLHVIKPLNNNIITSSYDGLPDDAISLLSSEENSTPLGTLTFYATGQRAKNNNEEVGPDVEVLDSGSSVTLGYQETFLVFDDIENMSKAKAISFVQSLFNASPISSNSVDTSAKPDKKGEKENKEVKQLKNRLDERKQISDLFNSDDKNENKDNPIDEYNHPLDEDNPLSDDPFKKIDLISTATKIDLTKPADSLFNIVKDNPMAFGASAIVSSLNSRFNFELAKQRYNEAKNLPNTPEYHEYKKKAYEYLNNQLTNAGFDDINHVGAIIGGKTQNVTKIISDYHKNTDDKSSKQIQHAKVEPKDYKAIGLTIVGMIGATGLGVTYKKSSRKKH